MLNSLTSLPAINGGHAQSGNGDSVFDASGYRGNGLTYSPGVPSWMVGAGVVGAGVLVYVLMNKRGKR